VDELNFSLCYTSEVGKLQYFVLSLNYKTIFCVWQSSLYVRVVFCSELSLSGELAPGWLSSTFEPL